MGVKAQRDAEPQQSQDGAEVVPAARDGHAHALQDIDHAVQREQPEDADVLHLHQLPEVAIRSDELDAVFNG